MYRKLVKRFSFQKEKCENAENGSSGPESPSADTTETLSPFDVAAVATPSTPPACATPDADRHPSRRARHSFSDVPSSLLGRHRSSTTLSADDPEVLRPARRSVPSLMHSMRSSIGRSTADVDRMSTTTSAGSQRRRRKTPTLMSALMRKMSGSESRSKGGCIVEQEIMENVVLKTTPTPSPSTARPPFFLVAGSSPPSPATCDETTSTPSKREEPAASGCPGTSPFRTSSQPDIVADATTSGHGAAALVRRSQSTGKCQDVGRSVAPNIGALGRSASSCQDNRSSSSIFYDLPYGADSYMFNRATPSRRGFGGIYRRTSHDGASRRDSATAPETHLRCQVTVDDDDDACGPLSSSMPSTLDRRSSNVGSRRQQTIQRADDAETAVTGSDVSDRHADNAPPPPPSAYGADDMTSRIGQTTTTSSYVDRLEISEACERLERRQAHRTTSSLNSRTKYRSRSDGNIDEAGRRRRRPTHNGEEDEDDDDERQTDNRRRSAGGDRMRRPEFDVHRRQSLQLGASATSPNSTSPRIAMTTLVPSDDDDAQQRERTSGRTQRMNSYCRTDSLVGAAGVRKADSFDSGIDTKTESTAVRSSLDDHDDVSAIVTPTDETTSAAGGEGPLHSRQSTGCSSTADTSKIVGEQAIQTTDGVPMEQDDEPPSPPTILPLTDAEARYDRLAKTFVERLNVEDDEDIEEPDASLCRTLLPPSHYKTATHYMNGLFDNVVRLIRSPDDESDRSASDYNNECVDSGVSTGEIKATLLGCVRSKIQVLDKEKRRLQQEINCLRQTTAKVSEVVRSKVSNKDFNKYSLYVDELGKVLRLLLMLAARRARAEVTNHVTKIGSSDMTSPSDSDSQGDKRVDDLLERFNDAVALKSGIDRRRAPLDGALRQTLSADELAEYQLVVDATCRAHLDLQWVDDRLQLAQRQLTGLMDNILEASSATEC